MLPHSAMKVSSARRRSSGDHLPDTYGFVDLTLDETSFQISQPLAPPSRFFRLRICIPFLSSKATPLKRSDFYRDPFVPSADPLEFTNEAASE